MVEMGEDLRRLADEEEGFDVEDAGERRLLSRYGIWLLVELCKPAEDIPIVSCLIHMYKDQKINTAAYV